MSQKKEKNQNKQKDQTPSWVKEETPLKQDVPQKEAPTTKVLPSFWQLLKEAWQIYKKKAWEFIAIFLLAAIVSGVVMKLWALFLDTLPPLAGLALAAVAPFLGILIMSWGIIAALILILSEEKTLGQALQEAFPKIVPYFWIAALVNLITVGGMFPLIVPGIILGIALSLTIYVFVKEDRNGLDVLLRSSDLTRGFRLTILGRLLSFFLALLFVGIVVTILVGIVVLSFSNEQIADAITSLIIIALATPLLFIYNYIIYQKLTAIKPAERFKPSQRGKNVYTVLAIWGLIVLVVMPLVNVYVLKGKLPQMFAPQNFIENMENGRIKGKIESGFETEDLERLKEMNPEHFEELKDLQQLEEMQKTDIPMPTNPN